MTPFAHGLSRISWIPSQAGKLLRDRGRVPRRLTPTSLELTMGSFSQARHLGGLPRASPVPFRGMLLTETERPAPLSPNGSSGTCIPEGAFAHSIIALHSALRHPGSSGRSGNRARHSG
jgi:hypothetical protein